MMMTSSAGENTKVCVVATDFLKKAKISQTANVSDLQFAKTMVKYHSRIHARAAGIEVQEDCPLKFLCQPLIMRPEAFFTEFLLHTF